MTCEEALLAISAALDGELPPVERARLSEHLVACESCRELAEDLRVLTDALEDSDRQPPAGLAKSVRAAVEHEAQAAPALKKRRPPYPRGRLDLRGRLGPRGLAAMLALCMGLGGIGLVTSRQADKGDAAGASLNQAAPESLEKSAVDGSERMRDETDAGCDMDGVSNGAVGYSTTEGGESAQAPMEAADAVAPQLAPADAPMPSSAPAPSAAIGAYNYGGAQEDTPAGGSDGAGPTSDSAGPGSDHMEGEEKLSLTPEEALELVFEHLGGYEKYPEARQRVVCMYGFDAPAYYLKTVETDIVSSEYCLDYAGPPPEGEGYYFHFYEMVTDKREDGFDHTATMNWYTVSPDGKITAMF